MQDLKGFSVPKGFRGGNGIKVQLWWAVQATLFAWSPQIMYRWRAFLLRLFGAKIGKNVVIRPSVKITYPWKLTLGDYAWVGDEAVLYTPWRNNDCCKFGGFTELLFVHRQPRFYESAF